MTAGRSILVTGAGGFIGSLLAAGLADLGHRVIALDRAFDSTAIACLGPIPRLLVDLAAPVQDLPACDVILHAAALASSPAELGLSEAEHVATNMALLTTVIRHAGRARPAAFVFLSSSGVFGGSDGGTDLADTDLPTATGPYAAAKKAGEALVPGALGAVCQTHVLRLGYLYGPGEIARPTRQHVSLLCNWMAEARAGRVLAVPANDPRRDWTYAPDLAPVIARLIDGPGCARPIHLCTPQTVPDSVLAALIRRHHPGLQITAGPPIASKPPMRPSRHPAIDAHPWTPVDEGIAQLVQRDAA